MCACKEDQATAKVSEQSYREVNCTKEWILELIPRSKWRSPTFSSRAEGVRSLDWEIKLSNDNYDNYSFNLYLLTDIKDEIEVNHTFSIERIDRVIFEESTKQEKFHKSNKVGRSKPFVITCLKPGLFKIKLKLTYMDSIRVLDLEKSVMVLLGNLDNMLADSTFSDLTLCVRGKEFKVHKGLLAAISPVFAKQFKQELKDDKLEIDDDLEPGTIEEMLKFIYTGISPNLSKMAEKLLIAADRYMLEMLKTKTEFELICTITRDNAKDLLLLADKCSAPKLKDEVKKFLAPDNAEFAMKSEEYLKDELQDYLGLSTKSTDVTLCVKDKELKAHKNLLSSQSSVFASMFKSDTKEKLENRVEIHDLEPETVLEMLKFIYTGISPNLPNKMAEKLLVAADRYQLKLLKADAEFKLIRTIIHDNAKELLLLADKCSASELKYKVKEFLAPDHAEFATKSEEYLLHHNPKSTDVILCVKGKEFKAHKKLLSSQSSVFKSMFKQESEDKLENQVELHDLEPETVEEMLNFIYTGEAPNLHKMAKELLIAADRYQLEILKKKAEIELICTITQDNAKDLLVLAEKCSASELKDEVEKFTHTSNKNNMASQSLEYKEKKFYKYWTVSEFKDYNMFERTFTTSHENGIKNLDWKFDSIDHPPNYVKFRLHLLTDIEDELDVKYKFIINHRTPDGHHTCILSDSGNCKFKTGVRTSVLNGMISKEPSNILIFDFDFSYKDLVKVEKTVKDAICQTESFIGVTESSGVTDSSEITVNPLQGVKFTDVKVCVGDQEIEVHKTILSAHSSKFDSMFNQGLSDIKRVEIKDLLPNTVREMLEFIYYGRVSNLTLMAQQLLRAAHLYEIETLKKMAEEEVVSSITLDNVLKLLVLADECHAEKLYSEAMDLIVDKYEELEKTNKWKSMVKKKLGIMSQIKKTIDEK